MAKLISVEKSKYINKNIEIYSQNKIGQYSKFLNKNPIFVTYYHINKQHTRTDIGTGGIHSPLGESSPLRFNKILNFPVYNLPELKPDVIYDENGFDIELDLNDIVVLPNTVKPSPDDYMIVSLPGAKEILFRVNNVEYNTIQSNDFYMIDLDIKKIDDDIEKNTMRGQIIETYHTIFENIGTQDRCFIRIDDIDKINSLAVMINQLKDFYKSIFYNHQANSFVLYDNYPCECEYYDRWLYDPYLEKFISDSNIYYKENDEEALVLTPNDVLPSNFEYIYSRTLWFAVLKRSMDYLNRYIYAYQSPIVKRFSPFKIYDLKCNSSNIFLSNKPLAIKENDCALPKTQIIGFPRCIPVSSDGMSHYFSEYLIRALFDEPLYDNEDDEEIDDDIGNGDNNGDIDDGTKEPGGDTIDDEILEEVLDELLAEEPIIFENYLDEIIYNYMKFNKMEIEKDKLLKHTYDHSLDSYMRLPLVLHILNEYYREYFLMDNEIETD